MTQMVPALPNEPVGVGARWVTVSHVQGRMSMVVTNRYQLLQREPDRVVLEIESSGEGGPQPVEVGQPGVTATLDSLSTTGRGRSVIRLGGIWPRGESTAQVATAMRVQQGENEQHVETRIQMTTEFVPN